MNSALKDIFSGLSRWHLWLALAQDSFRERYHRTLMGPIWITLTFLAFISVKIYIFSELSKTNLNYFIAHLTLGMAIWNYFTSEMNGGATAFISSRNWILGIKMPYSLFIYESTTSSLINFFFSAIAALLITGIFYKLTWWGLAHAALGTAFVTFSFFWVKFLFAQICVFFRDMVQFIATGMRIAFFLTPIIWVEGSIGPKANIVFYNPFYHYMNIMRSPLRDGEIATTSWIVVVGITFAAMILSIAMYQISSRKITSHI